MSRYASDVRILEQLWEVSGRLCSKRQAAAIPILLDGRRALTGSRDETARLWDLETQLLVRTLQGHTPFEEGVAVSSDGRMALTLGWDCTVRLWELDTGKQLCILEGHTGNVNTVAFSLDGAANHYDSSNDGELEHARFVRGSEVISLRHMEDRYYRPGLLARAVEFDNETPRDAPRVANRRYM